MLHQNEDHAQAIGVFEPDRKLHGLPGTGFVGVIFGDGGVQERDGQGHSSRRENVWREELQGFDGVILDQVLNGLIVGEGVGRGIRSNQNPPGGH